MVAIRLRQGGERGGRPAGERRGGAWAVELPAAAALAAGRLRLRPDIEVAESGRTLWLRGRALDERLESALRKLPGAILYLVEADGLLTRPGQRLPAGTLPPGDWSRLMDWLVLKPQPALGPGALPGREALSLVPDAAEREPGLLLAQLDRWARWAVAAAALRLEPLRFAVSAAGEALVWGRPIPPVAGSRFVEAQGVAVPCGLAWSPPLDAQAVRDAAGAAPGDLVLLWPGGDAEIVPGESFIPVTRAAVRRTLEGTGPQD